MCGICGIYTNPNELDKTLLKRMVNTIQHRGPDDRGTYISAGLEYQVGLGHARLSIIDLSKAGQQPMSNEDGTIWITYNGEIYNFLEIKRDLETKGHIFKSKTDSEVVIHSYEEWGIDCLKKFNGMFAFGLWDEKEKVLFLARDRVGIKPLYYYENRNRLIFASEIKAILQARSVERKIDWRGAAYYFSYGHSFGEDTLFEGIKKLLPGHYLIYKEGKSTIKQYWDIEYGQYKGSEDWSETFCRERLLSLIKDSVQKRLISDVPLGAFLSGGIDSSAVVSLMNSLSDHPVKTFSVGFNYGKAYNELSDAKVVAKFFNTDHYELMVETKDLTDTLLKLIWHYDEPLGDAASIPVFLVSKLAREHVKVVLTGEGSDEIFGGYRRYVAETKLTPLYQMLPHFLKDKVIAKLVAFLPRFRRLKKAVNTMAIPAPDVRFGGWLSFFDDEMKTQLFSSYSQQFINNIDAYEEYRKYYPKGRDTLNKLLYTDFKTWLPNIFLEKIDKASMAEGLEARVPFLDHELVEFAANIPAKYKIKNLNTKYILKKTMNDLLPASVLKKKKQGFAVPTDPWFRGELKDFIKQVLLDRSSTTEEYFNRTYIEDIIEQHFKGQRAYDKQIYLLLSFKLWHKMFLEQTLSPST